MIPFAQFKRAVSRFEKASRCLKCVRAAGPRERASILFEFRASKRELLELGKLLITGGPVPMKSLGPEPLSLPSGNKLKFPEPSFGNKPKNMEPLK